MIIKKKMVYDNDDEFGIQLFRNDFKILFDKNSVKVKRYKRKPTAVVPENADFMGLTVTSIDNANFEDTAKEITVSLSSVNSKQRDLVEQGRDVAGVRSLSGLCEYTTELYSGDIIEFILDNPRMTVKKGERFVVNMEDGGDIKLQFCFGTFTAYSLGDKTTNYRR